MDQVKSCGEGKAPFLYCISINLCCLDKTCLEHYIKYNTTSNPMSNNQNFINLDDDDNQPARVQPKPKPIPSGPGINSFVFPKLHQMLQRRKGKPEEEVKISQPIPEVIKVIPEENEVCKVVTIAHVQRQESQFQVAVQMDKPKTLFDQQKEVNVPSDIGESNLLAVEEAYQPLMQVESERFQSLPVTVPNENKDNVPMEIEEPQPANDQNQQQEAPIEPQLLQVCEDIPIIDEYPHQHQHIQPNAHEQPCEDYVEPAQPSQEQPVAQQNLQQSVIISSAQEPIIQIPTEAVQLQPRPEQKNMQGLSSTQIKKLLKNLLPDMNSPIEKMNDEELADIYRNVMAEIEENQLQSLLYGVVPQSQQEPQPQASPQAQAQQCLNAIEVDRQPSLSSPVEPIEQNKPAQPDKEQASIKALKHLKTLPFEELKAAMKGQFPFDSDQYDFMDHEELISMLNQCILQMEKSSKGDENIESHQIQSSVSQAHQPQQKSPTLHQLKPAESAPIENEANKISEMKQFLLENIPTIRPQQLQSINNEYIKMLYDGAINGRLSRAEIGQKIGSYTTSILDKCLQKFPHLKDSLSKISEEEMYGLMNSLANGRKAANEIVTVRPPETKQTIVPFQQIKQSKQAQKDTVKQQQVIQVDAPQKRTHDMMLATNPRRQDETKPNYKRRNPAQLREKLLNRLPQLKEKIMMLDDSEIEKIYSDSIEKNKYSHSARHNEPQARPVIMIKQKKPTHNINRPETNREEPKSIADQPSSNGLYKGKLLQISNEQKKKKSRTIIFVHTEEDSDDEGKNMKLKRTQNGVEKKSGCDCLQKASVGTLLKRLTQLIDNKN